MFVISDVIQPMMSYWHHIQIIPETAYSLYIVVLNSTFVGLQIFFHNKRRKRYLIRIGRFKIKTTSLKVVEVLSFRIQKSFWIKIKCSAIKLLLIKLFKLFWIARFQERFFSFSSLPNYASDNGSLKQHICQSLFGNEPSFGFEARGGGSDDKINFHS